jgi:hypothetical protein
MDDRSERLRKRRNQSIDSTDRGKDRASTGSNPPDETSESGTADGDGSSESDPDGGSEPPTGSTSIKEKQTGTYMYLPDSQTKELRRLYNVLKAEYEFQYDDDFEKNRHFYPLVIQFGLDGLESMDVSEVRRTLREQFD